jgi:hypothetical protein
MLSNALEDVGRILDLEGYLGSAEWNGKILFKKTTSQIVADQYARRQELIEVMILHMNIAGHR